MQQPPDSQPRHAPRPCEKFEFSELCDALENINFKTYKLPEPARAPARVFAGVPQRKDFDESESDEDSEADDFDLVYDTIVMLANEAADGRVRIKDLCKDMEAVLSDVAVTRHVAEWIELDVLLWDPSDKTVSFAHALTDDFEAPIRAAAERARGR